MSERVSSVCLYDILYNLAEQVRVSMMAWTECHAILKRRRTSPACKGRQSVFMVIVFSYHNVFCCRSSFLHSDLYSGNPLSSCRPFPHAERNGVFFFGEDCGMAGAATRRVASSSEWASRPWTACDIPRIVIPSPFFSLYPRPRPPKRLPPTGGRSFFSLYGGHRAPPLPVRG